MSYYDTPEFPELEDSEAVVKELEFYPNEKDLSLRLVYGLNESELIVTAKLDLQVLDSNFIMSGSQLNRVLNQLLSTKRLGYSEHFLATTSTGKKYLEEINQPFNKGFNSLEDLSCFLDQKQNELKYNC